MRILGIDSSTEITAIALLNEGRLEGDIRCSHTQKHSATIIPALIFLLRARELTLNDIDAIAISTGPGAYTGLRVGLATVLGLVVENNIALVTVNTLKAMAYLFAPNPFLIAPILDAREGQVASALFNCQDGLPQELLPAECRKLADFVKLIPVEKTIIFTGEAIHTYKDEITGLLGERARFASPNNIYPSAVSVAMIGTMKYECSDFTAPDSIEPVYMKKFKTR
ncbi:tRNA (adenosine(37)-N6)-threonylcarbamoyltransferase complex dimerization subunit type 1 TsaB [bacterium]|nr:tRNA (adenosine(37)-N6)-threonylcarbamoyltransferase complex dimerization subunit type 1 TsaB [bacterium]